MFKAYLKHAELVAHGVDAGDPVVSFCRSQGVVRVEVEMKKRLLSQIGANDIGALSDVRIAELYAEHTSILRAVDRSEEVDLLDAIPVRSRAYASAWLAGQDVRALCSRRTLFRHAKTLREFGLDIMASRDVTRLPTRVRVIDLQPLAVPDWYELEDAA
jgi:Phage X family